MTPTEVLDRVDASWTEFRDAAERARPDGFEPTTEAGWTVRGMLSHVAAWHDATTYRLHRFAASGRSQPKVEPNDDAFNARIVAESTDRTDDEVVTALDGSFARLRAAIAAVPPGRLDLEDGWAEAVIAGNTWEHYEEHTAELAAVTATPT